MNGGIGNRVRSPANHGHALYPLSMPELSVNFSAAMLTEFTLISAGISVSSGLFPACSASHAAYSRSKRDIPPEELEAAQMKDEAEYETED